MQAPPFTAMLVYHCMLSPCRSRSYKTHSSGSEGSRRCLLSVAVLSVYFTPGS